MDWSRAVAFLWALTRCAALRSCAVPAELAQLPPRRGGVPRRDDTLRRLSEYVVGDERRAPRASPPGAAAGRMCAATTWLHDSFRRPSPCKTHLGVRFYVRAAGGRRMAAQKLTRDAARAAPALPRTPVQLALRVRAAHPRARCERVTACIMQLYDTITRFYLSANRGSSSGRALSSCGVPRRRDTRVRAPPTCSRRSMHTMSAAAAENARQAGRARAMLSHARLQYVCA